VAVTSPVVEHLRLLIGLRWQVLRNSWRKASGRLETLAGGLYVASAALVGLVLGAGFLGGAYAFTARGRYAALAVMLWVLFVLWQFGPVVLEGGSPAINFRELVRYPIALRTFALLNLLYGASDPVGLMALGWTVCLAIGVAAARPEWVARVLAATVMFALVNLGCNRIVFGFFERLMSTRRGREITLTVILVMLVLPQFLLQSVNAPWLHAHLPVIRPALAFIQSVAPPGLAHRLLLGTRTGWALAGLLAWICGTLLIMWRQLARLYRGEIPPATVRHGGAVQAAPGWQFPGLSSAFSAAIEKELRYFLREPRTFFNLLSALAFVAVLVFGARGGSALRIGLGIRGNVEQLYPAMLGYGLLICATFSYNAFGTDRGGFPRWMLSPMPLRQVLLAKNAASMLLTLVLLALITALCAAGRGLPPAQVARCAAGAAYALLLILALGNWLSVRWPKPVESGKLSSRNVSEMAMLLGMLAQGLIAGSLAALSLAARLLGVPWLFIAGVAVLIPIAAVLYRLSLDAAARRLATAPEELADALE